MRILVDYLGRPVRLTDERRRHILAHAEMAALEMEIVRTLGEPEMVVQSRTDPAVELCHRRISTKEFGDKWLCIVVKYVADDPFVLTAYLTDKVKLGVTLWPKP